MTRYWPFHISSISVRSDWWFMNPDLGLIKARSFYQWYGQKLMNRFPWWTSWFAITHPDCSSMPHSGGGYPFHLKYWFIDNNSSIVTLHRYYCIDEMEVILVSVQRIVISSMATFIFSSWSHSVFIMRFNDDDRETPTARHMIITWYKVSIDDVHWWHHRARALRLYKHSGIAISVWVNCVS